MRNRFLAQLALLTLVAAASLPLAPRAQSQDSSAPSVAEAARRAQRLKKKSDKPVQVITNDTLKPAPLVSSSAPATPAPVVSPPAPNLPAEASAPAAASSPSADASKLAEKLKVLKEKLVEAQKNLEIARLDLSLQQDTYFSNPDYIHDKDGKGRVDAKQLDVTEKERIVDELKVKIAELEGPQNPSTTTSPAKP